MKCPRQFTKFSTKGDTGELGPDCPECLNYFFGECIADKPLYVCRLPSATLAVFAVRLEETVTREATVLIYAKNENEARDAVDNDLERGGGILSEELASGWESGDGDIEATVYFKAEAKKGELVAYDGKVFTINDFQNYVEERGFEEDEEVPLVAEL